MLDEASQFRGTPRFEVIRCLGVGGMGMVYEVLDRERDARVALKTLHRLDSDAVLRFKREFRALQGLQHKNLVSLLELVSDGGRWFFTMELVNGVNFLERVRGRAIVPTPQVEVFTSAATVPDLIQERLATPPSVPLYFDEPRLRAALIQLAEGLAVLHAAGKVHRDIKPSNILVQSDGRVVLLDFGLVSDLAERGSQSNVVGTVEYMAPEQAAARAVGPEADWYSVGVVLYEALTAKKPHQGNAYKILQDKQWIDPPPPKLVAPRAPDDLSDLCVELMCIEPRKRPSAQEVLRRLGVVPASPVSSERSRRTAFVGRHRELGLLRECFERVRRGKTQFAVVEGPSGVGKSALVKHFTKQLEAELPELVVLSGRYYQREAVQYRALDSIMDAVSRFLMSLPPDQADGFLPADVAMLAQLFPSLRGVEPVSRAQRPLAIDPQEQRSRLHQAARELCIRLAQRRPVVVVIDDVQWSDRDSRAVFDEALRGPHGPALLALVTMRTSDEDRDRLMRIIEDFRRVGEVQHLPLGTLDGDEARQLAAQLLGGGETEAVAAIAEEAGGHPLFIDALARHTLMLGPDAPKQLRLDDALAARVAELDEPTRLLLELVALSGGPLAEDSAMRAAAVEFPELVRRATTLRVAGLVRSTVIRERDAIETFHDRVREVVLATLDEARRRGVHERLARGLETLEGADLEALFTHWHGAGDAVRAARYAALAAAKASEGLAFERAARLYQHAIELSIDPVETRRLKVKRADALANAGRGPLAAAAFFEALDGATATEALELRRRAAEQLLRAGRIDEGLAAVREVLNAVGLTMPKTPQRALVRLLWNRARIRLAGLKFKEREAGEVPQAELQRIDICWSVSGVIGMVDTIRGAVFQTLHMRMALAAGEPFRVARAFALEVAFSATAGGPTAKRTAEVLALTDALAERVGDPYLIAWARGVRGVAAALEGRWREGEAKTKEAEEILRTQCNGSAWELSTFQFFLVYSLMFRGNLAELSDRVPTCAREAVERGDLYGALCHRSGLAATVWLAADQPKEAREDLRDIMRQWSRGGWHIEHFWELLADTQIDLYIGDAEAAQKRVAATWPPMEKSLLLRVQLSRLEAFHLRGRAALAVARQRKGDRVALVAEAGRDARRIEKENMPWATPLATLLRAGGAAVLGNDEEAARLLELAAERLEAADMRLYAAAARRQRGRLLGGEAGVGLIKLADLWMSKETITDPARISAMLVPGFPD